MNLPTDNRFFQNAWVVSDLQTSILEWVNKFGVGPFYVIPQMELASAVYRGKETSLKFGVALAQAGSVQIELICQKDDNPSAFKDLYAGGREGFHHMGVFTRDYEKDVLYYRNQGFSLASECTAVSGGKFAYVDTSSLFGVMIEIVEESERLKGLYKIVADAAVGWSGKDPIRVLTKNGYDVPIKI